MRHWITLGLSCCLAASAAGQSEVIIRQPGRQDQVIRLDSTRAASVELRVDSAVRTMLRNGMMAEQSRALSENLVEMGHNLSRIRVDTVMPSMTLALRAEGIARAMQDRPEVLTERLGRSLNLLRTGARQPHFGISVAYMPRESDKWGAYVEAVTPGSPAEHAGIMSGDIITRIAGKSITEKEATTDDDDRSGPYLRLTTIISQLEAGKPVAVELRRGTQTRTVRVTPVDDDFAPMVAGKSDMGTMRLLAPGVEMFPRAMEMPSMAPGAPGMLAQPFSVFSNRDGNSFSYSLSFGAGGLFGNLELAPVNEKLGSYFGTTEGVLVVNTVPDRASWTSQLGDRVVRAQGHVRISADSMAMDDRARADSAAHKAMDLGLEPGDVIVSVDGRKVNTPSQLMRIVSTYDRGDEFKLQIMRQKRAESIPVKMP